jgi:hypothetical protein
LRFLATVVRSIFSPRFYATIPSTPWRSGFRYFLLFTLLLTIGDYIVALPTLAPLFRGAVGDAIAQISAAYPGDLSVEIQNGLVSTNARQPYAIPLTDGTTDLGTPGPPRNILVIDTETPFSSTQFHAYDTAAWLTRDALYVEDQQGAQIRAIDLSRVRDLSVDRASVTRLVDRVRPIVDLVAKIIGVLAFGLIFLWHLGRLLYLLVLAVPILLAARLRGVSLTYGEAYRVGLYAMTAGFLVEFVGGLVGFRGFAFMFSLVTILVVLVNLGERATAPLAQEG